MCLVFQHMPSVEFIHFFFHVMSDIYSSFLSFPLSPWDITLVISFIFYSIYKITTVLCWRNCIFIKMSWSCRRTSMMIFIAAFKRPLKQYEGASYVNPKIRGVVWWQVGQLCIMSPTDTDTDTPLTIHRQLRQIGLTSEGVLINSSPRSEGVGI